MTAVATKPRRELVPGALVPVAASPQKPQIRTETMPDGGTLAAVGVTPEAMRLVGGSDEPEFNILMLRQVMACARPPSGVAEVATQATPTQGTHACSNLGLLLMRGPPRFRWGHKPMQQRQRPAQLPCTTRA